MPKDCPEVVGPIPRSSSVQFYSCQTQHSPFLCKLFTFYILIFFYSKHFIHCDMVPSRLSWAWRDIYVVRSSQFIFCLSHNMTLFLEHSRLVNKKYFSYWKYEYKSRCYVKNVGLCGPLFPTEFLEGFIHIWSISDIQRMKGYSKIWKSSTREILNRK